MNWFAKNGDKVFSLATMAFTAMDLDAKALGLDAHAVAWVVLAGTILTAAHTLFFQNVAQPQITK